MCCARKRCWRTAPIASGRCASRRQAHYRSALPERPARMCCRRSSRDSSKPIPACSSISRSGPQPKSCTPSARTAPKSAWSERSPPRLKRKRLTRDDIEDLTWISREQGSGTSALADTLVGEVGITPKTRLALPSWEAFKFAVRCGFGIAAVSRLAVEEELANGSLTVLPILPSKARRLFSIIRIREAKLTPTAERFLALLRDHCARSR